MKNLKPYAENKTARSLDADSDKNEKKSHSKKKDAHPSKEDAKPGKNSQENQKKHPQYSQ